MSNKNYHTDRGQHLRYDAHGRRISSKSPSHPVLKFLLLYLLPYVVINGLILCLVLARPAIDAEDPDTTDYKTATVRFKVHSLLPLKKITASLEGENVTLNKDGDGYVIDTDANGNLSIYTEAYNKMSDTKYIQINVLDDVAPTIDEDSVTLQEGYLEFHVDDSQSGVNFDSIYGIDAEGDRVRPSQVNKTTGIVSFSIKSDSITVYVEDLAGNQSSGTFSLQD